MLSLALDILRRGLVAGRYVGLEMEGEVRGEYTDLGVPRVRWEWEPICSSWLFTSYFYCPFISIGEFLWQPGGNVYNVFELPRSQAFGQHKELLWTSSQTSRDSERVHVIFPGIPISSMSNFISNPPCFTHQQIYLMSSDLKKENSLDQGFSMLIVINY